MDCRSNSDFNFFSEDSFLFCPKDLINGTTNNPNHNESLSNQVYFEDSMPFQSFQASSEFSQHPSWPEEESLLN